MLSSTLPVVKSVTCRCSRAEVFQVKSLHSVGLSGSSLGSLIYLYYTGVFFMLDFSPMLVIYSEQRASLAKFLTGLCAIVGGIFAVASMVDGVLYRAAAFTQKKAI